MVLGRAAFSSVCLVCFLSAGLLVLTFFPKEHSSLAKPRRLDLGLTPLAEPVGVGVVGRER